MNKKSTIIALFLAVIMSLSFVLVACEKGGDEPVANVKDAHVIQYTDDTGTYVIDVKPGEPYSMSAIPTREGYDFLGLFDAEVGGTQYVNSQGASLAPFIDNKNLVLFPQFKAKEYRLVLNYQGAPVTGEREIVVSFGSRIQSLPMDLTLENKTFMGWWTEPDRKGLQVADEYGVLPEASLISSRNFDLTDPDGFIYDKHTPWCQIDFLSPPPNAMRGAPCALFACLGSRSRTPKVRSLILALKRTQHGVHVKYRSKLCARGHFMGC